MKPVGDQLDRLLRAASRAPRPGAGAAMFALESRVMAGWRASARADNGETLVLLWCRRAAIFACCLALISLAWNYRDLTGGTGDELAAADSAMRIGVTP